MIKKVDFKDLKMRILNMRRNIFIMDIFLILHIKKSADKKIGYYYYGWPVDKGFSFLQQ